jgi:hypothetical protein
MEHNQSNLGLDQCHHCGVRRKQVANPTTNYGFVLPTPTDLVTDLPADFDVALQGVDTRLKALQPGTTLGDLAYSSATANTNTRLAIGTTNQVLTVVAGVPAWTAPSASLVGCSLYSTTTQSIANDTATAVLFDSEEWDTDAFHSTVTNTTRITIPSGKDGKYSIEAQITFAANATGNRQARIRKNNSIVLTGIQYASNPSFGFYATLSGVLSLTAGDYLELFILQSSGGSLNSAGSQSDSRFSVTYLGA